MSRFRDLRMKQVRNSIAHTDTEVPCNNDDDRVEGQLSSHKPNGAPDESCHMIVESENRMVEYEAQPMNNGSKVGFTQKKRRGLTKLLNFHSRTSEERKLIVLNSYRQPIGPIKEIVKVFRGFLGTIARNFKFAPLIFERYIVAEEGRKCILGIVGARWRGYKCWVKKHHFYAYDTYEKRWEKRLETIPDAHFKDLLNYWENELVEELSNKNKSNQLKADDMHTLGPNSYALLRHEL
ncbi:hypothetical protein RDABS01_025449, partial [Bienertia sinuspersici]